MNEQEVRAEAARVRRMPHGTARVRAAERLAARVEAEGPVLALADALLLQVDAYRRGGELSRSFVPMARVTRWWDEHPELFTGADRTELLWLRAATVSDMRSFPQVGTDQVDRALAALTHEYQVHGQPARGPALERFLTAWHRGAPDTEEAFEAYQALGRDAFDLCDLCDVRMRAGYLRETGRTAQGVRLIEQELAARDRWSDSGEPHLTLTRLALSHLDLGDTPAAVLAHRRATAGWPGHGPDLVECRGDHVAFYARLGDLRRAVHGIESERAVLLTAPDPQDRFTFLCGVGAGTHLLRAEHGDHPVRVGPVPARTVAELDDWVRAEADGLAGEFDRRNGTDRFARLVRSAWATWAAVERVDLDVLPRHLVPATGEDEATAERRGTGPGSTRATPDLAPATEPRAGVEPGVDDRRGAAAEDPLDRAERRAADGDLTGAAEDYLRVAAREDHAGNLVAAGLAYAEAARCAQLLGDEDSAARGYRAAVVRLRAGDGDPVLTTAVLVAWAPVAASDGRGADLLSEADLLAGRLGGDRVGTGAAGTGDGGKPAGDGPVEEPVDPQIARARADLDDARARVLAATGTDLPRAVRLATDAAGAYTRLGAAADAGHAAWLAGRVCIEQHDPDGAVPLLETAVEAFDRAGGRSERDRVVGELIDALTAAGRVTEADDLAGRWAR